MMAFFRQTLGLWILVGAVLCLGAGPAGAAGSKKERLAYAAAVTAFHDQNWALADLDFAQFIQMYPDSANVPEAWLLEAQALFQQGRFIQAETMLATHQAGAGPLADAYTYWMGEAQLQMAQFGLATNTLSAVPVTSAYALSAVVAKASALARLGDWAELVAYLGSESGVLAAAAQTDPDNALVLRGRLQLAQAQFVLGQFSAAGGLLAAFKPGVLPPDLEWQRVYLLCQVRQQAGEGEAALALTTNLLAIARSLPDGDGGTNLSASVALHATVLEQLGRPLEAIAAFQGNLTNAPAELQRQAILKMAALSGGQGQFANAEAVLSDYVTRFTNSPAMDAALLGLGEMYLRDYAAQPGQGTLLAAAGTRFDELLAGWPNSPFAGEAYLDRGWCGWLATNYPAAQGDFEKAAGRLPPSEELAVARFKLGDVLFAQGRYADALAQYQAVGSQFGGFTNVAQSLAGPALYQSLRAQLQLHQLAAADATMARLVAGYPASALSETGVLLLGGRYTDLNEPAKALELFTNFEKLNPQSPARPAVDLAIARAYEQAANWPKALAQYQTWLDANPTNALLAPARYSQAWANYQAGNETNALMLFTNFVARFPQDALAPTAQMWVADHYYRLGDWVDAERNYKFIFQNPGWQSDATDPNSLYYPAQMMAGRAAVARTDYAGAIQDYFEKLEADTNCPPDLIVQAAFAHGSALMKIDSPDTNNPTTNFFAAARVFNTIYTAFPTNEYGARAAGQMGNCFVQLSRYDDATNYYTQAMLSPAANVELRSMAQVGLGVALEKKAALLPAGPDQQALLTQAQRNYLGVLHGFNLNDNETEQDAFWAEKAGLQAAELAGGQGDWRGAINIYTSMLTVMPQLQDLLSRKIDEARQHLGPPGK